MYYPKLHCELNHIKYFGVIEKAEQGETINIVLKG